MKAILEFDLENPQDQELFNVHTQAKDFYLAMWEFLEEDLRNHWKYEELPEEVWEMVDKIRTEFFNRLKEAEVSLEILS